MEKLKDLTTGGIARSVGGLAAPLILASFVQMAYTLTDMAWLGRLGTKEVAAVGACSFIVWLCNSFSYLPKVGAEISVSQALGARSKARAKGYANHAVVMGMEIAFVIALIVLIFAPILISFFRLDAPIALMGSNYLRWVAPGLFFTLSNNAFSGIYYGIGNSKTPFRIAAMGLIINMILDPILIFGLGPIPSLGTNGAAIATSLSQATVFSLFFFHVFSKRFPLGRMRFRFKLRATFARRIVHLGLPLSVQSILFACFSSTITFIVASFGHIEVAVFSVGSQIEAISWMTAGGLSTALGSFVGQNYGAGEWRRVIKGYRFTLQAAGAIAIGAGFLFFFCSEEIFSLFSNDPVAIKAGGLYLRVIALSQLFMVIESITAGAFNGMGRTTPPAIVSIALNFLRLPAAFIVIQYTSTTAAVIWLILSCSSIAKGIVLYLWFRFTLFKRLLRA